MHAGGLLMTSHNFVDEAGGRLPFELKTDNDANVRAHGHTPTMVHWGDIREILFGALPPGELEGVGGGHQPSSQQWL